MKKFTHGSSVSINEAAFESHKPLYGSKGNPPYYDPNDLHTHVWKKGKLGLEDNPKIRTYAKGKLAIKDCVYCTICHMTKDPFQSTVGSNRDIIDDIIIVQSLFPQESDYRIIKNISMRNVLSIKQNSKKETLIPKNVENFQNLFHQQEGIFDDYLEVEEVEEKR
jgi:hypothetical protein